MVHPWNDDWERENARNVEELSSLPSPVTVKMCVRVSLWPAISTVMRHLLLSNSCSIPQSLWGDQQSHNSSGMMTGEKRGGRERNWRKSRRRWQNLRARAEIKTERRRDDVIDTVCWGQMLFIRGNCLSLSASSRLIFISSWLVSSFPLWASSHAIISPLFSVSKKGEGTEQSWQQWWIRRGCRGSNCPPGALILEKTLRKCPLGCPYGRKNMMQRL